ncbi:hypothetical protein B566_EDAN007879 [Ephemera danica]|nr:hypothetical protein B566_EDAN007879 [Ephemera danica]
MDTESEVRLLRIIERAKRDLDVEISPTYCGAHAVPRGLTSTEATNKVINEQIPEIKQLIASKELSVENIDVFCEQGVFDIEQSRSILEAGKNIGLQINFHGDELHPTNSAEMGAALGATAISHLEEISDAGITAMAASQCVAVILPTTAYIMHLKSPPVRKMIQAGVPVALGTDFNPNAYCFAMPVVMNLACVTMGMSMPEALIAATLNAAAALGRGHTHAYTYGISSGKTSAMMFIESVFAFEVGAAANIWPTED